MTTPPSKSAAKDVNKSEEIRKAARAMKERGEKPRPVVIIATLKKQGITVSSPQVSMVLKRMGFRPRKRRSSEQVAATGQKLGKRAISIDDLIEAKKVVASFGGLDRALAVIQALRRLED